MAGTPRYSVFIVRFAAEVATKSRRTRTRFTRVLRRNVLAALERAGVRARLRQGQGRIFVVADDAARAEAALKRVFGIASFSRVEARSPADLAAMAETATARFAETVGGRRYAVRVRRRGRHPFRSVDAETRLGAALNPYGTVHLDAPDVTVHVEVLGGRAYFFTARIRGAGGLPIGTEGRALALFSGGFDSPLAAWRMMKRGVAVDFLFCNLAGAAYERQVVQVAKVLSELWASGESPRLYVVDFTEAVDELKARIDARYRQVVLKRLMYRAASRVARPIKAGAIVTGEAIGQVSSQTISNLHAVEPAADRLVLRPLVGCDKEEVMACAREIGTGLLSERIPEHCGLTERSPAVRSNRTTIDAEEAKLAAGVLDRAVANRRCIELDAVRAADLRSDYLFVDAVPEDAEVIDCQPSRLYARWHVPGAVNRTPEEVIGNLRRFDKRKSYVLYCSFGTQSARLAEIMQQFGYQAYALKGGIGTVRKRLEASEPS